MLLISFMCDSTCSLTIPLRVVGEGMEALALCNSHSHFRDVLEFIKFKGHDGNSQKVPAHNLTYSWPCEL